MLFAWVNLVRNEPWPLVLIARAQRVDWPLIVGIYLDFQEDKTAFLETRLDKASAVGSGSVDRGPCLRFVVQRDPPEVANVGQLQDGVHVIPSAR